MSPTVRSIESIVSENLLAKSPKKNNQEILKILGHAIFIIQKFKMGSLEYHKLKSTNIKIKKIVMGTMIIEAKTINRDASIPLISFVMSFVNSSSV
jgi:hypothetical protein